jgi:hypothetical protein
LYLLFETFDYFQMSKFIFFQILFKNSFSEQNAPKMFHFVYLSYHSVPERKWSRSGTEHLWSLISKTISFLSIVLLPFGS